MSSLIRVNTIILIINVFESIGTYLPNLIKTSKLGVKIITFTRVLLLPLFFLVFFLFTRNQISDTLATILTLVFIGIIHVSSGYILVHCFFYAPEYVLAQDLKGKATTVISFCITFGTFLGGLFANILTTNIVDLIKS